MKVTIPHSHTEAEAIARVKKLLDESRAQIAEKATEVKEEWVGNTLNFGFTAQGAHIEGTLEARDKAFELYAKLPFALRLFEGRIEKMIRDQAGQLKL